MKKCIRRWGSKLVFSEQGIALCRGIFGRQCKFLRWDEVAAVGYYVGSDTNVAYNLGAASVCPQAQQMAEEYNAPDLFVYFSVTTPAGFGYDDVIPIFRDGRNICFNLGGSESRVVFSPPLPPPRNIIFEISTLHSKRAKTTLITIILSLSY